MVIRKPEDVQRIARRVINDIFQEGSQIEQAGKVNQLLITWLNAHRLKLEIGEWKQLQEDINRLKEEVDRGRKW